MQAWHDWHAESQKLLRLVVMVSPRIAETEGVNGVWNIRQIIAHIAGWNREAYRRFKDFRAGPTPDITYDIDAFNASSVEALKLFKWRDTLETYEYTLDDLNDFARELSAADWEAEPRYAEWFAALARDAAHHAREIEAWLAANHPTS